jgi:hypothetical protein
MHVKKEKNDQCDVFWSNQKERKSETTHFNWLNSRETADAVAGCIFSMQKHVPEECGKHCGDKSMHTHTSPHLF